MTDPAPHLVRRVVQAAVAVYRLGMTREYSLDQPVAVRLPSEGADWYAGIYGPWDDDREGVHFAKGPIGLRYLRDLADARTPGAECERAVELLEVRYVPLHALAPAKRAVLQKAGVRLDGGDAAPDFAAKGRNRSRTAADKRDFRTLEALLLALVRIGERGPPVRVAGEIPTLSVTAGDDPGVQLRSEVHADDLGRTDAPIRLSNATETWPLLDERWVLGMGECPSFREEAPPEQRLFVVDEYDGRTVKLLGSRCEDTAAVAREFLRGAWIDDAEPGFAREMTVIGDELRALIAGVLAPRGVTVRAADAHPILEAAVGRTLRASGESEPDGELDGWRDIAAAYDLEVARRVGECISARDLFRRYFGPWHPDVEDEADEGHLAMAYSTMVEWAGYSWRPRPNAPTVAERILRGNIDERARALVAAHAAAAPSVYVVRAVDPEAGTLVIEDVFTGERLTANDVSLSRTARPDTVLVLRAVPVGPFVMLWLAGPNVPAQWLPQLLEEIERCGVPATREGIAARPEVFGRIWRWVWEQRKRPSLPRATNTDGDDLVFHEAVYELTDADAVRSALAQRTDLEYEPEDDLFAWERETAPDEAGFGDFILLGRLRFLGDELIAEVNSERRCRTLRAWLDVLPGVRFRKLKVADMDAMRARERAPDDRFPDAHPTSVPPEALAALAEMLDEHWRTWPDVPVPMFGGMTPRDACATPEGRARVGAFLRTLTSPHPSYDIAPARERLLRDLGF